MGKVRQAEAVYMDSAAFDWLEEQSKPQPMTTQVAMPSSPIRGCSGSWPDTITKLTREETIAQSSIWTVK